MANSDDGSGQQTEERCRALTEGGDRCGRTVSDGQFCYQHDEDDPTVDDSTDGESDGADESADQTGDEEHVTESSSSQSSSTAQNGSSADSDESGQSDQRDETDQSDQTDQQDSQAGSGSDGSASGGVLEVRSAVVEVASDLIGRPLDGVVEVGKTEDGWRAVVEVVERRAVPDTQDILGRYELTLDGPDTVTGYRRTGRYRRADTGTDER